MKNAIKYICALLLLTGVSVNAWGDLTTSETLPIAIAGVYDADDGYATCTKTITFNTTYSGVSHYVCFTEYDDEINTFALTSNVVGYNSGYFTPSYSGNVTLTLTIYGDTDGTFDGKIIVTAYSGSSPYPTLEIPIKVTITGSCTSHSITLTDAGSKTGGSFSTNVSSSCQDETITITATPDAGYRVATWTVLDGNADDVELSGTGNTRTFTMPNSDTEVEVTFAAQTYDVTLKPNGGSGSDQVVSVTYDDFPPTELKGGGDIVIPTRTGYAFDGYYDNTSGGTQYYSYKGSPKVLAAEELWDKPNDENLYARWIANTTTVTLNKGTGGATDGTALIDYDATEYGDIDHAVNNTTGYHLDGYYTNDVTPVKVLDADGSFAATDVTGYITDGKWSNTSDEVTLYAHWALNTYTISFDKNGGSGSMDDVEQDYGSSYALPACGFTAPSGKVFDGWAEGSASGTKRTLPYNHTVTGNITFYALWRDGSYTNYVFSCAELTLTPKLVTAGTPIFITSAAGKKVRSQDSILIVGSGLTPNQELEFPSLPSQFEIKSRTGGTLAVGADGSINAVAYVFYTPDAGTTDILNKITGITVSVEGAKPIQKTLTHDIIGRRLPAEFVIAVKHDDNQWYALPADLGNASNPFPVAIRVNNESNPTIAYCANTNSYTLYQDNVSNSQKVILGTTNNKNGSGVSYALWGSAGENTLGINTSVVVTGNPGDQYKWTLTQTATSISTIADAKYNIRVFGNSYDLKLRTNAGLTKWGFYNSGVKELRLLTLSEVAPMTIKVMEWGTDAIVVSYPNGGSATSPQVRIGDGDAANVTLTSLGGDIYKIATISDLQDNPAKTEGTEKLFLRNCTFCKQKLAYVQFFLYLCSVIRKRHA